jgi:hypothetical protein
MRFSEGILRYSERMARVRAARSAVCFPWRARRRRGLAEGLRFLAATSQGGLLPRHEGKELLMSKWITHGKLSPLEREHGYDASYVEADA